ncbi:hypothetical protein KI688_009644 [Linnemannia hyalina]|uniref:Uncharacterized protein n=1 Tax=Linnemannia hyalina TaxID=64524 RepID=A0A9P7Y054_9FUNG|nr:hypothetical protein KI688_009644 [Linnemannia hyalina]
MSMDYLSTLIPECLDLIITHLLLDNRQADVAALLQVNKTLAAEALRHLYADPFQHPFHPPAEDYYCGNEDEEVDLEKVKKGPLGTVDALARMLLARRGVLGSVPEVVAVVFPELAAVAVSQDTNTLASPNSNPLDYLTHIRHLNLCIPIAYTWQHEVLHTAPPATLEYIQKEEFRHTCGAEDMLLSCRRRLKMVDDPSPLYHEFFRVQLMREVNWMLVNSPCVVGRSEVEDDGDRVLLGQQLKSLVIPVSDVERYLDAVCQFKSLEHVGFCLDEMLDYLEEDVEAALEEDVEAALEEEDETNIEREVEDIPGLLKRNKDRKEQAMEDLFMFVQEHGRLFPGQLKTVTCPESEIWQSWGWISLPQKCPDEVQFRILQLLPPLKRPSVLCEENWMQFLAHPRATDLGTVEKIDAYFESGKSETYERLVENRGFLQRCRGLRTLSMGSLGKGAYKWAVEEKKAYLENNSGGKINNNDKGQERSLLQEDKIEDRHLYLRHGLVPLEIAYISGLEDLPLEVTDEIDDIAYAFSETLTTLNLNIPKNLDDSILNNDDEPTLPWTIRIGRGWVDLPNLRDLYIDARVVARLVLDPELLVHCPNLVSLSLYDDSTFGYTPEEAIRNECFPALLGKCDSMTLQGWTALTFHPETLSSMREKLVELSMRTALGTDDLCFILPPPLGAEQEEEQEQKQEQGRHESGWYRWTWDWELPWLTKLDLNSKFAYEFQFQFLASCPLLESLHLNIHTSLAHTRDLDRSVLSISGASKRMIVLPKLRELEMLGGWTIVGGNAFLEEFLSTLCPNLEKLVAKHWNGVTLSGFLSILRKKDPMSQKASPSMTPQDDGHQDPKDYNKVREMELAGRVMRGGDDESELITNLGLVYMGWGSDDEVEGEVLGGVEFSFEYRKFYVLKSPLS